MPSLSWCVFRQSVLKQQTPTLNQANLSILTRVYLTVRAITLTHAGLMSMTRPLAYHMQRHPQSLYSCFDGCLRFAASFGIMVQQARFGCQNQCLFEDYCFAHSSSSSYIQCCSFLTSELIFMSQRSFHYLSKHRCLSAKITSVMTASPLMSSSYYLSNEASVSHPQ